MGLRHLSFAAIALLGMHVACADELKMPAQPPTASPVERPHTLSIAMPERGMSMREVEAKYGAPLKKLPAVGKPPITRWVYPDYTVYFEYKYVIHSVLDRKK